jgi:YspA, cpYpsA-related SLOG family
MADYRVIVTGSRAYRGSDVLREISLLAMEHGRENLVIVHGDCPSGADKLASIAARALAIREEPHPADWATHNKAAGPIRNQEMVNAGASLVLAFFAEGEPNRGTLDCVRRAIAAGIPVMRRGALVVEGVDVP